MVQRKYITYNQVHKLCQESAQKILNEFKPSLMIAIGGGGYVPARILRSFLKTKDSANIPIQAIGLSLYEKLSTGNSSSSGPEEKAGHTVTRTQWLDFSAVKNSDLVGRNILIVDEVDDTRTTLQYAVQELQKDVEMAAEKMGRKGEETRFFVFVLHNKNKDKKGVLPEDMMREGRYLAAETVGDEWCCYPWEATDIDEHDRLAAEAESKKSASKPNGN
ncbi:phosphoribosyltransferase-like protein [Tricharina praecox]|uniref:phosphoribosyltransferase-like protein n=1 Tax=Tricharina praecox TaxID=43433 RepID=UPI0022208982|nr:phosphoribosyltransferase-like protein [Tricharina praecox]KAI5848055.1 phosphoribosyltransferase-like protein [Tricharina praecox]